ncbi:hypothetical protein KUTeg_019761 [Tegillarca granosa]|uniref:Uncharacterized protein n=1 Tax=Tegillarca granosa TaxID=220873 RepID=A0ABQ9EDZ2_TEGGR|nr:hypothetical protein KUTeg_019761 [Tegillarca granosa]
MQRYGHVRMVVFVSTMFPDLIGGDESVSESILRHQGEFMWFVESIVYTNNISVYDSKQQQSPAYGSLFIQIKAHRHAHAHFGHF